MVRPVKARQGALFMQSLPCLWACCSRVLGCGGPPFGVWVRSRGGLVCERDYCTCGQTILWRWLDLTSCGLCCMLVYWPCACGSWGRQDERSAHLCCVHVTCPPHHLLCAYRHVFITHTLLTPFCLPYIHCWSPCTHTPLLVFPLQRRHNTQPPHPACLP